jgi:hypothetical protein
MQFSEKKRENREKTQKVHVIRQCAYVYWNEWLILPLNSVHVVFILGTNVTFEY